MTNITRYDPLGGLARFDPFRDIDEIFRGFTLGQDVDQGAAKAKYSDGVLELRLPKKAGGAAKQLTIS